MRYLDYYYRTYDITYHHYNKKKEIFETSQHTSVERVFIVEQYYSNKSLTRLKRAFASKYNLNINIKTVSKVVGKWRANGTMHNPNMDHSGRSKHVRSEETIVILNEIIQENPSLSVMKPAAEVGISRGLQGAF